MNIQEIIDKQLSLIVRLQAFDRVTIKNANIHMAALASAIEGLRSLQAIADSNSKTKVSDR